MKTYNNKILFIILAVLIAVYCLSKAFRSSKRENNLQLTLLQVDTAKVSRIVLHPHAEKGSGVTLLREAGHWKVSRAGLTADAESGAPASLLNAFVRMDADRIMTHKKSHWDEYHVGDMSGTRVQVFTGGDKPAAEWWIGEGQAQGGMYGGGQSYIRLPGKDEVYAVDGYLNAQFDRPFNDWRNKTFLRLQKEDITGVKATGVGAFSLEKTGSKWTVNGQAADSAAVAGYLNKLYSKNVDDFADGFKPAAAADAVMEVLGKNQASVQAWKQDSTWVLQSSQRPGLYFRVKDKVFREELLTDPKALLPKAAK